MGESKAISDHQIHTTILIDCVTPINHQRRPLDKGSFAAGQEKNAIRNLLSSTHAFHRSDVDGWTEHFGVRLGHGRVDYAGADAVDADVACGVLGRWWLLGMGWFGREGRGREGRKGRTSMASHLVMLIIAALLPQYAAGSEVD